MAGWAFIVARGVGRGNRLNYEIGNLHSALSLVILSALSLVILSALALVILSASEGSHAWDHQNLRYRSD